MKRHPEWPAVAIAGCSGSGGREARFTSPSVHPNYCQDVQPCQQASGAVIVIQSGLVSLARSARGTGARQAKAAEDQRRPGLPKPESGGPSDKRQLIHTWLHQRLKRAAAPTATAQPTAR